MDLQFTEEQSMLRETVRSLVLKEYPEDQVKRLSAEKAYPAALDRKLSELGLYGICFPEEYEGSGLGPIEVAVVIEELSRYTIDFGMSYGLNLLGGLLILGLGSEEQKSFYLPKMISGDITFSVGYHEPYLLLDLANPKVCLASEGARPAIREAAVYTEKREAEKNFVLLPVYDGEKLLLGIVPQAWVGTGEALETMGRDLLGLTRLPVGGVHLDEVHIIGGGADFLPMMTNWLKFINLLSCIGNMQTAIDQTVQYSKEREQFGRPIGTFQALTHLMVDTKVKVDASRLYGYWVAWLMEKTQGLLNVTGVIKEINMANAYVTSAFVDTVNTGIQVMGGYGYMQEVSMERYARDARMTTFYIENAFLQKLTIAYKLGIY